MTGDSSEGSGGRKGHTPRLGCVQAECWRPWEVCPRKHAWGLACAKAETVVVKKLQGHRTH